MWIACFLCNIFYGQLIGKIDKLKYRYWDLTVHVPGRQMHRAVWASLLWCHSALTVQGLCGLITVTSQYEGYVITSLWCHSMGAVWAHHYDVTVASQYDDCVSSYCYVTVTSKYEDCVSSSLWCHRDIQVRLQFDATVISQYENVVTSSLWCHCDIQVRLHFDVTVTSHHEDFVS